MNFNGLKFLIVAGAWLVLFLTGFVLFYLNDAQQAQLFSNIYQLGFLSRKATNMTQFMDDWNNITMVSLGCFFSMILCINELFIRRWFPSAKDTSQSYVVSGLVWTAKIVCNVILLVLQTTLICYIINISVSTPKITTVDKLEDQKYIVLLLGTSKYLRGTQDQNIYYTSRIETVLTLFRANKLLKLIISGDHTGAYNEPLDMKNDLVRSGVKNIPIILDGHGYRTFDSIIRAKELKGNSSDKPLIIVSQFFHLQRALFLSQREGVNAIGIAASGRLTTSMVKREWLAKTKVLMDVYLLNTQSPGLAAAPRRKVNPYQPGDFAILLTVLMLVGVSGRLIRQLVNF